MELVTTRTATEALVLETNLIKALRPKYNVLMKDDKDLAYVRISDGPVRSIERVRIRGKSGKHYGPYPAGMRISKTLEDLRRAFKVRSCRMTFETVSSGTPSGGTGKSDPESTPETRVRIVSKAGRSVPCMDHYIGICPAPCLLSDSALRTHEENVGRLERFLAGERGNAIEELRREMAEHAKALRFEEAQKCKERIDSLTLLSERQIARNAVKEDSDAISVVERDGRTYVGFCRIRQTELRSLERHATENPLSETPDAVAIRFLSEFYAENPTDLPNVLLTEHPIEDLDFAALLTELSISPECPKIGAKAELLSFLRTNLAEYALRDGMEKLALKSHTRATMENILSRLGFPMPKKGPLEMECYDISHTDGHFTVASRVVTTNGKANPAKYRKYKIKTLGDGQIDDFASLREVLYRRTLEGFESGNFPTAFVIDGGKGQLSAAREGIERAVAESRSKKNRSDSEGGVSDREKPSPGKRVFPVGTEISETSRTNADASASEPSGLPSENLLTGDGFRKEGAPGPDAPSHVFLPHLFSLAKREEEIFTEASPESFRFEKGSPELTLLQSLRDEAHRFAITFNRKTRSKAMKKNVLEELPGFGPVTRKKLLSLAGSVEGIRELERTELETVLNKTQIETLESHGLV